MVFVVSDFWKLGSIHCTQVHRVSGFDVFYHFYDKTILGSSLRTANKGEDNSLYLLIKCRKFLIKRRSLE